MTLIIVKNLKLTTDALLVLSAMIAHFTKSKLPSLPLLPTALSLNARSLKRELLAPLSGSSLQNNKK